MSLPGGHALRLAAESLEAERASFRRRTFAHLAVALAALVCLEGVLLATPGLESWLLTLYAGTIGSWLAVVGGSLAVGMLAHACGRSLLPPLQYLGLTLAVLLEGMLLFPLLYLVLRHVERAPELAQSQALATAALLGLALAMGFGMAAVLGRATVLPLVGSLTTAAVAALALWGPTPSVLGAIGAVAGLGFLMSACAAILLPGHDPEQHVAAALALLASAATLTWLGLRKGWELYASAE